MAAIINERDIQLQATIPRLLAVSTNYISMVPSTNTFSTTSGGVVPPSISIKAFKNGILTGSLVWDLVPITPYSTISDGISIEGTDVPIGTSVTVTASLTYLGLVYSAATVITRTANSSIITLEQTAANVNKSPGNVFTPSTVVFSGKVVDGANPPAGYAGRFVVDTTDDGSVYSNLYTSSANEVSYTYTPSISHKAVRVKLYAANGLATLLDQKSTTISESGSGTDGNIIYITPSSYVLAKNQNNVYSPLSVTFSAKSKTGINPATSYLGRFRIYENNSVTASYSSSSNESSKNYVPTVGCTSLKCELYLAGGFTTKIDEQGVTISLSGSNAVNAVLTNDAHVLPSDSVGVVTSYAGSGTQLYVYEGGIPIPYDEAGYTAGNSNTWKVVTVSSNVTVGTKTDGGTYADFGEVSAVSTGIDTSSVTFTISGKTSIGLEFTNIKVQKFAKSKQGIQGDPGSLDTSNLLKLNASNILTGTVVPVDSGGFKSGSISWNPSTGALTAGTGIAITEWGIIGASAGVATFTIESSSGAATFLGNITGGSNININGTALFKGSTNDAGSQYTVVCNASDISSGGGVKGNAGSNGVGVYGDSGVTGDRGVTGLARTSSARGVQAINSTGGWALDVSGYMTINNTSVVNNLNADMVDGKHASSLCQIVVTNSGTCTIAGNGFNLISTVSGVRTRSTGSNDIVIEPFSDSRLKNNIKPETLGMDFINKLLPVEFNVLSGSDLKYHGFIYQDVQKLIDGDKDSLSHVHSDGMGAVDYTSMVGPIVKSMQELYQEVQNLKLEVSLLTEKLKTLENK